MSLKRWLAEGRVRRHRTTRNEIQDLWEVVGRDLLDASIAELSPDRRFATAYNAILQLATIILLLNGLRTTGKGHHALTFLALGELTPRIPKKKRIYFDACRRKRNLADYDAAGRVSESEVEQIIREALVLQEIVSGRLI